MSMCDSLMLFVPRNIIFTVACNSPVSRGASCVRRRYMFGCSPDNVVDEAGEGETGGAPPSTSKVSSRNGQGSGRLTNCVSRVGAFGELDGAKWGCHI
jgi:hypothetical protein